MERSVLLVDSGASLDPLVPRLEQMGFVVVREPSPTAAPEVLRREGIDLALLVLATGDHQELALIAQLKTLGGTVVAVVPRDDDDAEVEALRCGADEALRLPGNTTALVSTLLRAHETLQMKLELALLRRSPVSSGGSEMLGVSPAMVELGRRVQVLAVSDRTTVLLTGEVGTGKALVARLIHDLSPRSNAPFVDVSCVAPPETVEASLFGQEPGPLMVETRSPGLLELGSNGTVFLDEVASLPQGQQARLVRALETRSFRRIGGTREVGTDARLIAATRKNLEEEVRNGTFREDLYYRLSVVPLELPPLRERTKEDRWALINLVLPDIAANMAMPSIGIETRAVEKLLDYSWPGNLREMRNVLERALMLAAGETEIGVQHLPIEIRGRRASDASRRVLTMAELEKLHIERTLKVHRGNRSAAARGLGIARATLIKKIKTYELDV